MDWTTLNVNGPLEEYFIRGSTIDDFIRDFQVAIPSFVSAEDYLRASMPYYNELYTRQENDPRTLSNSSDWEIIDSIGLVPFYRNRLELENLANDFIEGLSSWFFPLDGSCDLKYGTMTQSKCFNLDDFNIPPEISTENLRVIFEHVFPQYLYLLNLEYRLVPFNQKLLSEALLQYLPGDILGLVRGYDPIKYIEETLNPSIVIKQKFPIGIDKILAEYLDLPRIEELKSNINLFLELKDGTYLISSGDYLYKVDPITGHILHSENITGNVIRMLETPIGIALGIDASLVGDYQGPPQRTDIVDLDTFDFIKGIPAKLPAVKSLHDYLLFDDGSIYPYESMRTYFRNLKLSKNAYSEIDARFKSLGENDVLDVTRLSTTGKGSIKRDRSETRELKIRIVRMDNRYRETKFKVAAIGNSQGIKGILMFLMIYDTRFNTIPMPLRANKVLDFFYRNYYEMVPVDMEHKDSVVASDTVYATTYSGNKDEVHFGRSSYYDDFIGRRDIEDMKTYTHSDSVFEPILREGVTKKYRGQWKEDYKVILKTFYIDGKLFGGISDENDMVIWTVVDGKFHKHIKIEGIKDAIALSIPNHVAANLGNSVMIIDIDSSTIITQINFESLITLYPIINGFVVISGAQIFRYSYYQT